MSESSHSSGGAGPSHRSVEIGVVLFMALLAAIGIVGSLRVGIDWGAEGPKAGFFPFYISLIVLMSCVVNLVGVLREFTGREVFAEWGQIRQVLSVVIPTTIYVFAVPILGMRQQCRGQCHAKEANQANDPPRFRDAPTRVRGKPASVQAKPLGQWESISGQ